jgi:mannose-6-phosphate isomerase-like protein (cupin superfamily)
VQIANAAAAGAARLLLDLTRPEPLMPPSSSGDEQAAREGAMKTPINIEKMAKDNKAFRNVVDTGKYGQLVLISLRKGEDLGDELHPTVDELYFVVEGEGEIKIDGKPFPFKEDALMLVPAGTRHDVINTGKEDMKLFAMFTSPLYPANELIETREKAFIGGKH